MSETISRLYAATERTVSNSTYPGYPTKRLVVENAQSLQDLTLPEGEWTTRVTIFPSIDEQQILKNKGYELDAFGRPLHPWLRDMLSNPEVGVVTGLGEYWHWGPNYTADPIIFNDDPVPKLLLIQRGDTGMWALPGGFVDEPEEAVHAARRELFEEAGLLIAPTEGQLVYSGVVADSRTTAHAWAETTAVAWKVNGTPQLTPSDEVKDARWFAVDDMPAELHGSHAVLIESALPHAAGLELTHALSTPEAATSYKIINDGHMAYHRYIVTNKKGQVFIKAHDAHAFTDPVREQHSRGYLQKEKHVYDHLQAAGFRHIPKLVELSNDALYMDAYDTTDSWHWRAPKDKTDEYIADVFAAIDNLQQTTPPTSFRDSQLSTIDTHNTEGWHGITADKMNQLSERFAEWYRDVTPVFRTAAVALLADIPRLQRDHAAIQQERLVLCHHDLRQANVSWHEQHGTKIIDWSWAGLGLPDSDTTTLLVDLHKSGHDVSRHLHRFNNDHALTLIGFWLNHSLWASRSDDRSVRFHQAVSAVAAYDLLIKNR